MCGFARRLTRHKISDREPTATCHATKGWMANTHKVDLSAARGSLHRLVRPNVDKSLDALAPLILSALMPNGHCGQTLARGFKSNLGIGDLHKEVVVAFTKHFEPLSI